MSSKLTGTIGQDDLPPMAFADPRDDATSSSEAEEEERKASPPQLGRTPSIDTAAEGDVEADADSSDGALENASGKFARRRARRTAKAAAAKAERRARAVAYFGTDDPAQMPAKTTLEQDVAWCVRQLELGLTRPNVDNAQRKESEAVMRKLRRQAKTPREKAAKRSLMRNVFGDYRKFIQEERARMLADLA